MTKIATRKYASNLGGGSNQEIKCATKSWISSNVTNLSISGTYTDTQLVKQSSLSKKSTIIFQVNDTGVTENHLYPFTDILDTSNNFTLHISVIPSQAYPATDSTIYGVFMTNPNGYITVCYQYGTIYIVYYGNEVAEIMLPAGLPVNYPLEIIINKTGTTITGEVRVAGNVLGSNKINTSSTFIANGLIAGGIAENIQIGRLMGEIIMT